MLQTVCTTATSFRGTGLSPDCYSNDTGTTWAMLHQICRLIGPSKSSHRLTPVAKSKPFDNSEPCDCATVPSTIQRRAIVQPSIGGSAVRWCNGLPCATVLSSKVIVLIWQWHLIFISVLGLEAIDHVVEVTLDSRLHFCIVNGSALGHHRGYDRPIQDIQDP